MGNNWIIDVLDDLQVFARLNDLPTFAGQLDAARAAATADLAARAQAGQPVAQPARDADATRGPLRRAPGTGP